MIRTFILWVLSYTRRYENFREQQWKNYGSVTTWSYPGAPSRSGSPVGAKASGQWSLEAAYSPRRIQCPFPPASAWNACRCPTHPPQGTSLRPSQCPLAGNVASARSLGYFLQSLEAIFARVFVGAMPTETGKSAWPAHRNPSHCAAPAASPGPAFPGSHPPVRETPP